MIKKKYSGGYGAGVEISPNGEKIVIWDEENYWCYDLKNDTKHNISSDLPVSFNDKEDDHYGYKPDYGFVGWVKDQNAILVT